MHLFVIFIHQYLSFCPYSSSFSTGHRSVYRRVTMCQSVSATCIFAMLKKTPAVQRPDTCPIGHTSSPSMPRAMARENTFEMLCIENRVSASPPQNSSFPVVSMQSPSWSGFTFASAGMYVAWLPTPCSGSTSLNIESIISL